MCTASPVAPCVAPGAPSETRHGRARRVAWSWIDTQASKLLRVVAGTVGAPNHRHARRRSLHSAAQRSRRCRARIFSGFILDTSPRARANNGYSEGENAQACAWAPYTHTVLRQQNMAFPPGASQECTRQELPSARPVTSAAAVTPCQAPVSTVVRLPSHRRARARPHRHKRAGTLSWLQPCHRDTGCGSTGRCSARVQLTSKTPTVADTTASASHLAAPCLGTPATTTAGRRRA